MISSPRWLQEFQYFRAISILEIIILHTTLIYAPFLGIAGLLLISEPLRAIFTFINASAWLAVPQFVFISGFVLYNKYKQDFSVRQFYKKRLYAVLFPYLIFSLFYFIFERFFLFHDIAIGVIPIVKGLAEGIVTGTIGALWFVALILQFYLLYPLLVRVYNRVARRWSAGLGVLTVFLFLQIACTSTLVFVPPFIKGPTNFRALFLSNIFYFMLGIFACEHYTRIKQEIERLRLSVSIVVIGLAAVSYTIIFNSFFFKEAPAYSAWIFSLVGAFYCVLLIVFWLKVSLIWAERHTLVTRFMDKIGEDSFGLYLTHLFFVEIFGPALIAIGFGLNNLLYYLVLFVLVLAASYVAVHVIYRLPFSWIIIGKPRRSKDRGSITPERSGVDVS
jgi:peptidoglycan/LPS O-acetylase OafA/YrhL